MTLHDENKTDQNVVPLGKAAQKAVKGLAEKTGKPTDLSQKPANNKTNPTADKVKTKQTAEEAENIRKRIMQALRDWEMEKATAKEVAQECTANCTNIYDRVSGLISKAQFKHEIFLRGLSDAERDEFLRESKQMEMWNRQTELKQGASAMGKKSQADKT